MKRIVQTVAALGLLCAAQKGWAENWPNWRGPANDGISSEKNLPTKWASDTNVLWKVELPGPAGATPVVWDQHIFLTSVDSAGVLTLAAYDLAGKQRWSKLVASGNKDARGDEGNSASPSPVTDGKFVWTFMGTGDLACFDFDGKAIWKVNLQDRYGKFDIQFGMTSTPVLDGDALYMQLIHGDGNPKTREAIVVALHKTTGEQLWKVDRPSDGRAENEHSYASPIIYSSGSDKLLITHGCDYVVAHRLKDGAEVWRSGGLNKPEKYDPTLRFVASPVAAPGIVVVPSAKGGPVLALRPNFQGDLTKNSAARIWEFGKTPDVPSPLILDGIVYLCMQDGNFYALDQESGKELYPVQRTHRQRHRASPVYADGHIYLTARDGMVSVVKTGKTFEMVAQNNLEEDVAASPAISNGRIYFRTFKHLWSVGKR